MSKKRKNNKQNRVKIERSRAQRGQTAIRKKVGNNYYFTKRDLSAEDKDAELFTKSGGKWVRLGTAGELKDSRIIQKIKTGRSSQPGKFAEQNRKEFAKKLGKILSTDETIDEISNKLEEIKNRPEPTTQIYNPQITKPLSERVIEMQAVEGDNGETTFVEDKYGFKYELQSKYGLDKEKQAEINELFKEANKKLDEIRIEYGIELGRDFQLFKSNTISQINRKIDAAKKVLETNYVEQKAREYKSDYIADFALMLDDKDAKEFQDAMDRISDVQFLGILKETGLDYLVYAWDSLVRDYGYNEIWGRVKALISAINTAVGYVPNKEEGEEDNGLS